VIRTLWAAALVVGVAGCATSLPSVTDPAAWTTGRLSLQVQASPDRPSQSLSAAFELRGGATTGELRMLSPLGTLLVAASWNDKMATLSTPEGQRRFDNLDQLSQHCPCQHCPTGWPANPGLRLRTSCKPKVLNNWVGRSPPTEWAKAGSRLHENARLGSICVSSLTVRTLLEHDLLT
jgi:hypothetical protein